MAQKTSVNIKPYNIGSSEEHNRRKAEYLARVNKEKLYIRTELMTRNEAWVAPEFENSTLTDRYNQIAAMVKEKTGRAMQTKDRERVNKKTGKVTVVRGSTPLKEGVVVIKDDTTMEQLRRFCEVCKQRWGITAILVLLERMTNFVMMEKLPHGKKAVPLARTVVRMLYGYRRYLKTIYYGQWQRVRRAS